MITLDEYLASKSPEFRREVDKQYSEMAMEYSLSRLREELQMSQKEVADNLNISQPAVCKIEKNAEDVKLSTLIKYVNALGGQLSLQVLLPTGKGVVIPLPKLIRYLVTSQSMRSSLRRTSFFLLTLKGRQQKLYST